ANKQFNFFERRQACARVGQIKLRPILSDDLLEIELSFSSFPEQVGANDVEDRPVKIAIERREIKRDREVELFQKRISPPIEIICSIVKSDRYRSCRQLAHAQAFNRFTQRQHRASGVFDELQSCS